MMLDIIHKIIQQKCLASNEQNGVKKKHKIAWFTRDLTSSPQKVVCVYRLLRLIWLSIMMMLLVKQQLNLLKSVVVLVMPTKQSEQSLESVECGHSLALPWFNPLMKLNKILYFLKTTEINDFDSDLTMCDWSFSLCLLQHVWKKHQKEFLILLRCLHSWYFPANFSKTINSEIQFLLSLRLKKFFWKHNIYFQSSTSGWAQFVDHRTWRQIQVKISAVCNTPKKKPSVTPHT